MQRSHQTHPCRPTIAACVIRLHPFDPSYRAHMAPPQNFHAVQCKKSWNSYLLCIFIRLISADVSMQLAQFWLLQADNCLSFAWLFSVWKESWGLVCFLFYKTELSQSFSLFLWKLVCATFLLVINGSRRYSTFMFFFVFIYFLRRLSGHPCKTIMDNTKTLF